MRGSVANLPHDCCLKRTVAPPTAPYKGEIEHGFHRYGSISRIRASGRGGGRVSVAVAGRLRRTRAGRAERRHAIVARDLRVVSDRRRAVAGRGGARSGRRFCRAHSRGREFAADMGGAGPVWLGRAFHPVVAVSLFGRATPAQARRDGAGDGSRDGERARAYARDRSLPVSHRRCPDDGDDPRPLVRGAAGSRPGRRPHRSRRHDDGRHAVPRDGRARRARPQRLCARPSDVGARLCFRHRRAGGHRGAARRALRAVLRGFRHPADRQRTGLAHRRSRRRFAGGSGDRAGFCALGVPRQAGESRPRRTRPSGRPPA